ncbi:MAG: serine--tRNA ligase [Gammaproteobacteria bacterium]|jgi:seryl-tRNA synthetase|nr:serine--tRNA ligase [Gammaproteobacteria bacterium]MDP6146480.1 serine--tRNA ligase [Gammaproteobacteria bacterium]HJM08762.1 serine--tRNA ligase [Gammaproteobacteria bacterium]HJN00534.1 serine--tRNA ligase [Gammaproteobacteria bacterium]|tara:strand:- start:10034 stop:11305 length:1272 start_codon:yes stop_codon:yes gene_type:complete
MIDPKIIRKHPDKVRDSLQKRASDFDLDGYIEADQNTRDLISNVEELRSSKNVINKNIANPDLSDDEKSDLISEVGQINKKLKDAEQSLNDVSDRSKNSSLEIPNILDDSVPHGSSEEENIEIRSWGEIPKFEFEPKDHSELGENTGGIDFESAAKLSGSRFVVMKDGYAKLHRALKQFMLDVQTEENGYTEMYVPNIVRSDCLVGTGQLPKFADDQYRIENEEALYLIPTAEVPLTNLIRESILDESELPIKMTAHTPCFRQEAGSYGKDTKGMIRQHQFEKVELVHIVKPEESYDALEELTQNAESILKKLNLPYRVMLLCSGDTGFSAAKTYDLEVWLPSQDTYREISSCSNCESFQARRMKARFKNTDNNQTDYPHTLNGSGLAVGRTLIAVLENYQNEDGSVTVPDVLRPYLQNRETI